jgi:hypothetical protein
LIATSRGFEVVCICPPVKLLPGVLSTENTLVSAPFPVNGSPSPFKGTARNALMTSLNPGVKLLARLLEVTASCCVAAVAPVIEVYAYLLIIN